MGPGASVPRAIQELLQPSPHPTRGSDAHRRVESRGGFRMRRAVADAFRLEPSRGGGAGGAGAPVPAAPDAVSEPVRVGAPADSRTAMQSISGQVAT